MKRAIALLLALICFHAGARAGLLMGRNSSPIVGATGTHTITAQHVYFISPTGSDAANGTTTSTAWISPAGHTLVCGDIIVAQPSVAYSSGNFTPTAAGGSIAHWSQPTGCPSSSLGIDGGGGIYAVAIVCAIPFSCTSGQWWPDASNWAIEGFVFSDVSGTATTGVHVGPTTNINTAYVALINNVCTAGSLACFYAGVSGIAPSFSNSVDEFAMIGNVAFNGSGSSSECGSGLSINSPSNVDSLAGTHIAVIGNYAYGNINGICGPNSGSTGNFTTANGSVGAGSSTVTVASTTGLLVGYPIGVQNASGILISGIPQPDWVTNITGSVLTLNTATNSTIANGASIASGLTTDGEGLILDSWDQNAYAKQSYVSQNVFWGNGGNGMVVLCNSGCAAGLTHIIDHNTLYGNLQDYKHSSFGGEVNFNTNTISGWTFKFTNNILQASVIQPAGSPTIFRNVPSTNVGMGNAVVSAILNPGYTTVTGNFFKSAASATCPAGATCNGTNDVAFEGGSNYTSGNTLGTSPGLASPGTLPTAAPNCSGQANVYQCMVTAGVVAAVVPSGSAASAGYQPPSSCTSDVNYPTWTKGLNYIVASGYVNGVTFTENLGLSNRPCNL